MSPMTRILRPLIDVLRRITPKSVVRGVQLAVGVVLLIKGVDLMIDPDPRLAITAVGPLRLGPLLGVAGAVLALVLHDNRRAPAALVLIVLGVVVVLMNGLLYWYVFRYRDQRAGGPTPSA